MKLTFNDLERIINTLENFSLAHDVPLPTAPKCEFALAASILRTCALIEIPEQEKGVDFPEPPKMMYFTSIDAGGVISTFTLTKEQQAFVDQGRWKEITSEQGEEWQRTGRIVGVYEP